MAYNDAFEHHMKGGTFRLEASPSGHSLQVLAEDGSGLSAAVPNAKCESLLDADLGH